MTRPAATAARLRRPFHRSLLTAALLCSTAISASSADWVGADGTSANWSDAAHWSTGTAPDGTTPVVIGPNGTLIFVTNLSAAQSVDLLGGAQMIVSSGGYLDVTDDFFADGNNVRLTVSDNGSHLNIGGMMTLGNVVTFEVEDYAELITRGALLGEEAGENTSMSVHDDAHWDNSSHDIILGQGGRGYLSVYAGGSVETENLIIANVAGATFSELSVGYGGIVSATGFTSVGENGDGGITVSGGTFSTNGMVLGNQAGATGEVSVRDSSSDGALFSYGNIVIGGAGQGEFNAESGGGVAALSDFIVGDAAGGAGVVTLSDTDTNLNVIGQTIIGNQGNGAMMVKDGARFLSDNSVILGWGQASIGSVTVTDAVWDQNGLGTLSVGRHGQGDFQLDSSTAHVGLFMLGDFEDGIGAATLTNGAQMTVLGGGYVGYEGEGRLSVESGSAMTIADGLRVAGLQSTGRGEFLVSGNGSLVEVTGNTLIGSLGQGLVRIENGGRLNTESLFAGNSSSGLGALHVSGGNTVWYANGNAQFGGDGQALLALDNAGIGIVTGNVQFGNGTGAGQGELTVAGGGLLVGGDLTQYSNSSYSYVIGDGPSVGGGIQVSGTATIMDGAQLIVGFDGAVSNGDSFLVLETANGVTGTYTLVNGGQLTAFLSINAVYDPTTVSLVVSSQDFADVAWTPNQIATAGGLQSLGSGNALYDTILNIATEDEARFAFDQLSGEVHASLKTALIEDSRFVRNAANDRIRVAFGDATVTATPVLAYGPGGPERAAPDTDLLTVWGQDFGSWGDWDSDGNAASFSRNTGGLLTGADALAGDWRLGLMAGYSHSSLSADDRASSGSVDSYHLGLYGGTQWGNLAFRSGLAYAWHDIDTARNVAFPGFAEAISGSYDAGTLHGFGELAYQFDVTPRTVLEPFTNLAFVSHRTDAYAETGGAAALSAAGQTTETTFTTLGLRASHGFTLNAVEVTARGMLGWRHAFGDTTPTTTHAFAGGDAFTVAGVPIGKNAALVEAGLDFALTPAATLGFTYAGQFASGTHDQAIKANLNVKF